MMTANIPGGGPQDHSEYLLAKQETLFVKGSNMLTDQSYQI